MSKTTEAIRVVTQKLAPRGNQKQVLKMLEETATTPLEAAKDAAGAIAWGYRRQLVRSFNQYASAAEAALIVVCLLAVPIKPGLIVLGAVLIGLALRDAYTHKDIAEPATVTRYILDSAGDAAAAGVFFISSQALASLNSPGMALPQQVLYRSVLVCLPLLASLRMVLRPKPIQFEPFKGSKLTPEQIYKRTWRLNILWFITFYGVMAQNVTDIPNYFPDRLRAALPIYTFGLWIVVQSNALGRGRVIKTVLSHTRNDELHRLIASIPQRLKKGQPFYWFCRVLELSIYVQMSISLFGAVESFLEGKPLRQCVLQAIGGVLGFAVSLVCWQHVKASNVAAAEAIRAEISRLEQIQHCSGGL